MNNLWILAMIAGVAAAAPQPWLNPKAASEVNKPKPILVAGVEFAQRVLPASVQSELVRVNTNDIRGLRQVAIRVATGHTTREQFLQLLQTHAPNVMNLGASLLTSMNRAFADTRDKLAENQDARGFVQLAGGMLVKGLREAREAAQSRGPEATKRINEMFPNLLSSLKYGEAFVKALTDRLVKPQF